MVGRSSRASDEAVVDPLVGQQLADEARLGVAADAADQPDLGPEGAQHRGDARRAAEPVLAVVGPQERDRRFLADPLGVAPDVAVEDQVADDQDAGVAERLDASDQVVRHARVLPDLGKRAILHGMVGCTHPTKMKNRDPWGGCNPPILRGGFLRPDDPQLVDIRCPLTVDCTYPAMTSHLTLL